MGIELGGSVFEITHDLIGDLFRAKNAGVTELSEQRGAAARGGRRPCSCYRSDTHLEQQVVPTSADPRQHGSRGNGDLEVRGDGELEEERRTMRRWTSRLEPCPPPPAGTSPLRRHFSGSSSLPPLPAAGAEQQRPRVGPAPRPFP
jgi:hypothetical protein